MEGIKPLITIDVVSDVVCPWCYIGKKRLEEGIQEIQKTHDVAITYHPFQLDANLPKEGVDYKSYMERKFGADFGSKFEQVEQVAQHEGLDFDMQAIPKAINTFTLHRILTLALQEDIQKEVKEALMKAYFVDRLDLTQDSTLVEVMKPFGWSEEQTLNFIHSDIITDEVNEELEHMSKIGVTGVPFFIINKKYGFSGAQPAHVFADVMNQVAEEMVNESLPQSAGTCDPNGGCC